jgi:tetratricopeptide (TPR) repeat protein
MSETRILTPSEVETIDAKASVLMKQGISRLADADVESAGEALACFDRALELRRQLPTDEQPLLRYGLAACWLNRADALMRRGDAADIGLALAAYDESIRLLSDLPMGDDARFPRRLAIAHQNRGLTLQAQGEPVPTVIDALNQALAVLVDETAAAIPDRAFLLAAVWLNLANASALAGTSQAAPLAKQAALRAMGLVAELEADDADAAEVGLKARHVLCQIVSRRLAQTAPGTEPTYEDVDEATDAVDDALTLARGWEKRGLTRFRGIAYDLFRFGARVYAAYQPQFVNEFVLENTDPEQSSADYVESAEMQSAAAEALGLLTADS